MCVDFCRWRSSAAKGALEWQPICFYFPDLFLFPWFVFLHEVNMCVNCSRWSFLAARTLENCCQSDTHSDIRCTHARTYVCICKYTHIHVHIYTQVEIARDRSALKWQPSDTHFDICWTHAQTYVYVCKYTRTHMHANIHVHTYTQVEIISDKVALKWQPRDFSSR